MAIKDNLPDFITEIKQMADLIRAEQPELDRIEEKAAASLEEFFAGTFTDATAEKWEELMGFSPAPAWEIERRRERVRARLLSTSPMSKAEFQAIVENAAGTEVQITEDADNYTITIKFIGIYGVSPYLEDIKMELERIRPFHLQIIYEWIYTQHTQLSARTHTELMAYTHEEIRMGGAESGDDN